MTATAVNKAAHRASQLGWYEDNGTWYYAHATGVIGPNDAEEQPAPAILADLDAFTLPDPPDSADDLRAAVMASIGLLDAEPEHITVPLLGATYRAALGYSRVSMALVGRRGTGKTALATFAVQHFSPSARHYAMPGCAAASLPRKVEQTRNLVGDMLLPFDDLRSTTELASIVRSQFAQMARSRVTRAGEVIERKPRSLPLITTEPAEWPESVYSRVVVVHVEESGAPVAALLNTGAERRASLTAAMVRHYAPAKGSMDGWLRTAREAAAVELPIPNAPDPGTAARQSELVGDLAAGWRAMLGMAVSRSALSEVEAKELWARVMRVFRERH